MEEKIPSFSPLQLPYVLLSFFSHLLPIFLLRLADQMFEKINKTLPAVSFHRLLFLRYSPLYFSLFLSLSAPLCDTLRHALRGEPLQREERHAGNKGGKMTQKG